MVFYKATSYIKTHTFVVKVDSNYHQIVNSEFRIKIIDEKTYNLSCSIDDLNTYDLNTDRLNKNISASIDIDDNFKFGEQIKTKFFSFKIVKTKAFNINTILENQKDFLLIYIKGQNLYQAILKQFHQSHQQRNISFKTKNKWRKSR